MSEITTVLDDDTRTALLQHVRDTAARVLSKKTASPTPRPKVTGRFGGAFVTLYRGVALRGCVGTFLPTKDLASTLEEVTHSSLADSRFQREPITLDELPKLTIEVSVLTDPVRTRDPATLTPGVHGIIIRRGPKSGCFLPKVATERGWNAEAFLSECCTMKAGLPADAWRQPDTEVYLFSAESFSEDR